MAVIAVSYLRHVRFSERDQAVTLQQSKITETRFNDSWPEFVADFLQTAVYPKPSSNKFECYGWTPTVFAKGLNKYGQEGHWRVAANGGDELSLFVADLDNHTAGRAMIDIDTLEAFFRHLGLSFVLYTSFTHTPEKHKVRIVTPVTRYLTPDEAFRVGLWFNAALDYQLDGAIYDQGDYLYGPPLGSDIRTSVTGAALDVDHYLTLTEGLDEEARGSWKRGEGNNGATITPEQYAHAMKMAAMEEPSRDDVSIHNPAIFPARWRTLLTELYQGGSRSRTLRGLCAKAWVRSQGSLTKGDLWTLYREMDAEIGGYCLRKYGFQACDRDIKSAMEAVGSNLTQPRQGEDQNTRLQKEMARLAKRRA